MSAPSVGKLAVGERVEGKHISRGIDCERNLLRTSICASMTAEFREIPEAEAEQLENLIRALNLR